MAIPRVSNQYLLAAMKYIDENGVPKKNRSSQYAVESDEGKFYPPKYLVAIANHLENGTAIETDSFVSTEAVTYLKAVGYHIVIKQEMYEINITARDIVSTDENFTVDNLEAGTDFKPMAVYFKPVGGEVIHREFSRGEQKNTNQTLSRLACQVFEKQLVALSDWDKERFPVCQYSSDSKMICGIFSTVDEYKKKCRNSIEYSIYSREGGPQFVTYCWTAFSTLIFAKECLKRFGNDGDMFVLKYREKTEQEKKHNKGGGERQLPITGQQNTEYLNDYSKMLLESKNIIFRGAPGTGKSFLAKEIAAYIISDGFTEKYADLTDEQKEQVEFVQFHPSYDYSDFVEGLRPKMNDDGSMGFELRDGVFKGFVEKARKNYEDSQKAEIEVAQENFAKMALEDFFQNVELGRDEYKTIKENKFFITSFDDRHINISIPENPTVNVLSLNIQELQKMLESGQQFDKISDITNFFGKQFATQAYSYDFALFKAIMENSKHTVKSKAARIQRKEFIFIIDEINRGEISKILGELFFSIDPGYRGKAGEVATQYSNMQGENKKFYIPDNVYIIGTMNDIDRSVDSFDFAMRRRFRFIEIKAEDTQSMLEELHNEELKNEAMKRMNKLNDAIMKVEDLNENYQIGASYFLKLSKLSFDELWTDYLQPLLQEYVRGMYDEAGILKRFAEAYGYQTANKGDANEATQD